MPVTFDTLVIGAGTAGLTTARILTRHDMRVLVLEARDRVGGRLWSSRSDGVVLDYGASWIHGIDDNPLADAVAALGLNTTEFTVGSYQPDSRPIAYYSPDGTRLSDDAADRFAADIHTFDELLATTIAQVEPRTSYSSAIEATVAQLDWGSDRSRRVREFLAHRAEEQLGVSQEALDAHGLDDDAISGDEVVFPDGYDRLATRLAEGLDVRCGHVVTQVRWSSEGVTANTDRGEFSAARIVVTVPIGVLRSPDFVFEPPLPQPLSGALSRLDMNAFEKVFLTFPRKFWEDGVYGVRRQGDAGRWWHSWYDVTGRSGPPTLLTFAAGPCARETRNWSDDRIADSVVAVLREMYGDGVPDPSGVHVTRWQDDPFSRGSYSYMTVGSVSADHDDLATPVHDVVHIAGEATWTNDPSTVTGAFRSGHRAAERILGSTVPFDEIWRD